MDSFVVSARACVMYFALTASSVPGDESETGGSENRRFTLTVASGPATEARWLKDSLSAGEESTEELNTDNKTDLEYPNLNKEKVILKSIILFLIYIFEWNYVSSKRKRGDFT